ncbi:DNA polymerase family B-domain-containing protein [Paraphysoderma sedebokerense]|nr:DNA polymerase family B-domain-containing protein [Paraphysoderma sedebokerense]
MYPDETSDAHTTVSNNIDKKERLPETQLSDKDDAGEEDEEEPEFKVRVVSRSKATVKVNIAPKKPPVASVVQVESKGKEWLSMSEKLGSSSNVSDAAATLTAPVQAGANAVGNIMEEDGTLNMYWIDAYERNGVIFLFGKVYNRATQSYISCCVRVEGMERNLFLLPRERRIDANFPSKDSGVQTDQEVKLLDVYTEFDELRVKYKINQFASKFVERKYAFEIPGIPQQASYLKVSYGFNQPALPTDLTGKTFWHVFGANTNALELFILKRKLMGPCWLQIKNAAISKQNVSWCRFEVTVSNPKNINPFKESDPACPKNTPPLVVACLNLKTILNHQKNTNEIVIASLLVYPSVKLDEATEENMQASQFTAVRQLANLPFPFDFQQTLQQQGLKVEINRNEIGLLNYLMAMISKIDPDIIVGHNVTGFDLDVLLHRMKHHKIGQWSKIGRLRRTEWPKLQSGAGGMGESTYAERSVVSGRLLCDTYLSATEFVRAKSYSLTQLSQQVLKINREEINFEKIPLYFNNSSDLVYFIKHSAFDAWLTGQLMFQLQALPLTKQLTNLAGNLWSRTLSGGRAERNEYLLLHEFYKNKFIRPDKIYNKHIPAPPPIDDENEMADAGPVKKGSRRKPAYAGGLVLEPKKGFYDKFVVMLDFNSLYPSIIQEYNIDFTTVERFESVDGEEQIPEVPDSSLPIGTLPRLLKTLVDRRRAVKGLMKTAKAPSEVAQLDIRQKALKLTANSMYGCLGFTHSRFYAKPLAMLITSKGREILQNTVDLAESDGLEVIYGDTDSIMIYTNTDDLNEVKTIGRKFKSAVNNRYKLLEIEMDGFFQRMLLLKKKKYAALLVEEKDGKLVTTVETKGLDLVRRDWCGLSHDVSNYVLQQILSGDNREDVLDRIHKHLSKVGEEVRQGLIPIEKYVINKGLTKQPEAYADAKSQPHVQVALRMKGKGQNIRVGDTIPFVICQVEDSGISYALRAYHPDDVAKAENNLKIDYEWYLQQQVHPPVARLCEPIEGTDNARIADCLGLDASKYHVSSANSLETEQLQTLDSLISDEEKFKDADKLFVKCINCGEVCMWEGVVRMSGSIPQPGNLCPNPSCNQMLPLPSLICQLTLAIRSHIIKYQNAYLVCDDASCLNRTRSMTVYGKRCLLAPKCKGTMRYEYSAHTLYRQLTYYESLFDTEKFKAKLKSDDPKIHAVAAQAVPMQQLKATVTKYLDQNSRRYVDLTRLFSFCKV